MASSTVITLEKTASFIESQPLVLVSLKDPSMELKETKTSKSSCQHYSTCSLVDYHSLPNFLKHNEFVVDHYRSEWPLRETILSAFSVHNETLNIWTHLIGFFIFLALATAAITHADTTIPSSNIQRSPEVARRPQPTPANTTESMEVPLTPSIEPVARWPLYAYLSGAMFCLLASSACHLLSCHSEGTCYAMIRLDYAGISALIVTSFYPLVYYSFACLPFYRDLYLGSITVFGAATVLVSLLPAFEAPEFRYARSGLFACMALSGLVPIVHKLAVFGDRPEAALTTGYEMVMGVFYGVGVVVYAMRIPERWLPGRFDLVGHSHQLFHLLVIAGAYTHYLAGLVYLGWRDMEGCSN